ncbi:hypothetical protein [Amnibacterium kyonggiense]
MRTGILTGAVVVAIAGASLAGCTAAGGTAWAAALGLIAGMVLAAVCLARRRTRPTSP